MAIVVEPVYCYDRAKRELQCEPIMGGKWIVWAYNQRPNGPVHRLAFKSATLTKLVAAYFKSRLSRGRIEEVVKCYGINLAECRDPRSSFRCFNDFFIRRLKPDVRPCDPAPTSLVSPVDGRIFVYPRLTIDEVVPVKGYIFSIDEMLTRAAPDLHNGSAVVIRLNPGDCHRIHFPCGGDIVSSQTIPGTYHSVHPLAEPHEVKVYCENTRCVTMIQSKTFGRIGFVEVGAFGVGSIVQTYQGTTVVKGREKGYFQYGGSTVIMIFEKGRVGWADDLVANTVEGYETMVRYGEAIGRAKDVTGEFRKGAEL